MISPVLVKIWVVDLQMDSQQGFSTADGGDHQRRWRCVLAVRLAGKGLNGTSSIDFRYEENRRGGNVKLTMGSSSKKERCTRLATTSGGPEQEMGSGEQLLAKEERKGRDALATLR